MSGEPLSINQARASVYRLLSACFYQPEQAFLEEDIFGQLNDALGLVSDDLALSGQKLGEAFRGENLDLLLLDYSRLFLGPFDIPAKPYGSVYLDGQKVVMGDSTLNVLANYRQGDCELAADFREVPDHVAVELEFLYLLTCRENDALAAGQQDRFVETAILRKEFLKNHLGRWVTPFCRRLHEHAGTGFYRQLAEIVEAFAAGEASRPL